MQLLPTSTLVQVKDKRGYVLESQMVPASNGGEIPLHTIVFNQTFRRGFGSNGKWESIPETKPKTINYSFIKPI